MRLPFHAFFVAAAVALSGCGGFGPGTRLCVRLPELPPHWRVAFPDLGAELEYPGADGALVTAALPRWDGAVEVGCPKRGNGPFLAWPVPGDSPTRLLRPAGGLYPWALVSPEDILLSWADGPLALLVATLAEAGFDVTRINSARLGEEMRERADPWEWDITSIATRLAEGGFTENDLDALPEATVRISPGPGEWFLESPFRGVVSSDSLGALVLDHVTWGGHLLAATDGRLAALWVDRQGAVTLPRRISLDIGTRASAP